MPKMGTSGLTKKELIEALLNGDIEASTYQANLDALNDSDLNSGGGGDTGLRVPDLMVAGTGPYVIPANFDAIVHVSCRDSDVFTINGFPALGSSTHIATNVHFQSTSNVSYTVPNGYKGSFYTGLANISGGLESYVTINGSSIGVVVSLLETTTRPILNGKRFDLGQGKSLAVQGGSSTAIRVLSGYIYQDDFSFHQQTFTVNGLNKSPPNVDPYPSTVLDGGTERLIELYAV